MNWQEKNELRKRVLAEKKRKNLERYWLRTYDKAMKERDYFTMKKAVYWLQRDFGYDGDYIPGKDDGEAPAGYQE